MKKFIDKIIILFLLSFVAMTSCDNYERTEVISAISANYESLELFVGEEVQLTASPQDGGAFVWESEDPSIVTVSNGLVSAIGEGSANIIIRQGSIMTTVPVTVLVKIPLTGIKLNKDSVELFVNAKTTVIASQIPENANSVPRTEFYWWTENESVAIVNAKGDILGMSEGTTKAFYRKGDFIKSVFVDIATTRPFMGPHVISKDAALNLRLRDFDLGGEGYAYHDSDNTNSANHNYRKDNGDSNSPGVDVEGGGNIGYVNAGEWLIYTVEVKDAGTYAVQLAASGNSATGQFHLEVDGVDVTGQVSVPPIGSWSNWKWYPETPKEITLKEGKQKIKLYIDASGFNINELKFQFLR